MESLTRVRPRKCSFDLDVPTRNVAWYLEGGYEPFSTAIFRTSCLVADVVIDIGSHIGYYSCLAASVNPAARIIAVEASKDNGLVTSSNALMNNFEIEVLNVAFGNTAGIVDFEITEASDNCGISGHPNSPTLDKVTIDSISGIQLAVTPNQRLVIKIDVEGHELSALQGLDQILFEAADVRLLLEFNPKCILSAGTSPEAILEWLWNRHFRVFSLNEQECEWQEVHNLGFADQDAAGYVNLWCVPSASALTVSTVMHSASLGGAERSHIEVVENLIGAGCMVHTILPEPDLGLVELLREVGSSTSLVTNYPWWVVPKNHPAQSEAEHNWQGKLISQDVIEAIRAVDPDVVLTQTIVAPQGALSALVLGKPHVWWIREFADLDHDLKLPLTAVQTGELISNLSTKVLTNSAAVRDYFFPSNPELACVVHPIPRLNFQNAKRATANRPWTIGIVASLQPGKGHSDAFVAMAALTKEGLDFRLACIGPGGTEDVERLQQLAEKLGIDEKVIFTGQISDRASIYNSIDAVVITSRAEAFGRVAFEATDAGLPVIYPLSGGILEYMVPGETGLEYISKDTHDLARSIKYLATNLEVGDRLVSAARKHFERLRNDPTQVSLLVTQLRASRDDKKLETANSLSMWLTKSVLQHQVSLVDLSSAIAERDGAIAERDAAIAERDGAIAERDGVLNSRIWKISLPYRKFRALFKF